MHIVLVNTSYLLHKMTVVLDAGPGTSPAPTPHWKEHVSSAACAPPTTAVTKHAASSLRSCMVLTGQALRGENSSVDKALCAAKLWGP
mgnify:CR=1 FL=1